MTIDRLRDLQQAAGATFELVADLRIPTSFGNDLAALQAAQTGVVLVDRSHWGRIEVLDTDRLTFLHNQSTNNFQPLKPGQGCDTIFVTSTARTIDLVSAYVTEAAVLLLVSPSRRQKLLEWLDRFIFFGDRVQIKDVTETTAVFSLIGPKSSALFQSLNDSDNASGIIGSPGNSHQLLNIGGTEVRVAVGSGLATEGYTLITNMQQAAALWGALINAGAMPLGEQGWEQLRIIQGRPKPDHELTEDYNPLEAGLWQTVSFDKGCYIGQETIARLNTYQGVKQQLWGVRLSQPAEPGTVVTLEGSKVGKLTSFAKTTEGFFGLVYIRTKAGSAGLEVYLGEGKGELVELPFLSRSR